MSPRERTLLFILMATLGLAAVIFGVGAYFDRLTMLDQEFVALQKRVLLQVSSSAVAPSDTESETLRARFFPAGPIPAPLLFASSVQDTLKNAGLTIAESRVLPADTSNSWVEFRVEGDIEAWFAFLRNLRGQDARTLFRSLSLIHRSGARYFITFEVGHVVL